MAFITTAALPRIGLANASNPVCTRPASTASPPLVAPLDIQAAKHVQFKATKKHERKRPRKHRPSDINRKPPPYDTQPLLNPDLPPMWSVMAPEEPDAATSSPAPVAEAAPADAAPADAAPATEA